jgi:hypothetical protein
MPEESKKVPKKNNNFIIFTVIFLVAIVFFNLFIYRNMRTSYDIIEQDINYSILADGDVILYTTVLIAAENEKSFNSLMEGFKTPDHEKRIKYQELLDDISKKSNKTLSVIDFQSTVEYEGFNITVYEDVIVSGFVTFENNNNSAIFSLEDQQIQVDSKTKFNVIYPSGWVLLNVSPNPNKIDKNKLTWSGIGNMPFPQAYFETDY